MCVTLWSQKTLYKIRQNIVMCPVMKQESNVGSNAGIDRVTLDKIINVMENNKLPFCLKGKFQSNVISNWL